MCNLDPMVLAGLGWIKHGSEKLHYKLDDYFDETVRHLELSGGPVDNFHRTLSSYVNAFLDAGFIIEGIREPKPTDEQVARLPAIADNLRVPEFIVYLLRKP